MIIACPRCETTFTLPDELYKPGKMARCSRCSLVFPMPVSEEDLGEPGLSYGEVAPPLAAGKTGSKRIVRLLAMGGAALGLLALLCYGGYLVYSSLSPSQPAPERDTAASPAGQERTERSPEISADEQARIDSIIYLDEIRQFVVENTKIGKLMIIQGVAVNRSAGNKDYVRIRARLLDEKGQQLEEIELYCGVPLTLFQVQNLSREDLQEALNNRVAIMTNNTNIPPGGKTDFVVVFPNPPETVRRFEIRVTEVRDSPQG
jgi:hypothetical protein